MRRPAPLYHKLLPLRLDKDSGLPGPDSLGLGVEVDPEKLPAAGAWLWVGIPKQWEAISGQHLHSSPG